MFRSERRPSCESPTATAPANLLRGTSPPGVSIDELFGREMERCLVEQDGDNRLRHLLGIEKLDVTEKCQVL